MRVSALFIDKLSLTYDIPPEEQNGLIQFMRDLAESEDIIMQSLYPYYRNMGYRWNWKIPLPFADNRSVLISLQPRDSRDGFFRVEWNPHRTTRQGNAEVWELLHRLLLDENFQTFVSRAHVTRIDLAVDVSPLTPNQIWVSAPRLINVKHVFGRRGSLRTMILGSRRGRKRISIYNRDEDEEEMATDDLSTTRFEVRLRFGMELRALQTLANPFDGIQVCWVSYDDPSDLNLNERLFLDSVRHRGAHAALQLVGDRWETRQRYRDLLYERFNFAPWRPASIWRGWERALAHVAIPGRPARRRRRLRHR